MTNPKPAVPECPWKGLFKIVTSVSGSWEDETEAEYGILDGSDTFIFDGHSFDEVQYILAAIIARHFEAASDKRVPDWLHELFDYLKEQGMGLNDRQIRKVKVIASHSDKRVVELEVALYEIMRQRCKPSMRQIARKAIAGKEPGKLSRMRYQFATLREELAVAKERRVELEEILAKRDVDDARKQLTPTLDVEKVVDLCKEAKEAYGKWMTITEPYESTYNFRCWCEAWEALTAAIAEQGKK